MIAYQRNRRQSLTERLQLWGIHDHVAFTKTGHAETGVEFTLPTSANVTDARRVGLAESIRMILLQAVPQEWRGRLIIENSPIPQHDMLNVAFDEEHDNDLLGLMAKQERQALEDARIRGELQRLRYFFTVRMKPRKRRAFLQYTTAEITAICETARVVREQVVNMLNAAGFDAWEMTNQEVFELTWRYLNPGLASARPPLYQSRFALPDASLAELRKDMTLQVPTLRRQLSESEIDASPYGYLVVGDRLVTTVSMQQVGESTYPGMIENLLRRLTGSSYYVVVDADHLYQPAERKALNNAARGLVVSTQDESLGTPDVGNSALLDDITRTLYTLTQQEEHVFRFGVSVVLIARERHELERIKEVARTEISMLGGALGAVGTVQNIVQYLDKLVPFSGQENEFLFKCTSRNIAHLFPLTGAWKGATEPIAVFRNRWGNLTGLNPSDGTTMYGTLVIASAGSGKSFFTQGWATRLAALGSDVIIVDQKRDYDNLVEVLGGQTIPFMPGALLPGTDEKVRINPFDLPPGVNEPDEDHKMFLMAFFSALLGSGLSKTEKTLLMAAIDQTYAVNSDIQPDGTLIYNGATLSDFVRTLKNLNQVGTESIRDSAELKNAVKMLTFSLQSYTGSTALGSFLDGPSTVNINNPVVYFDIHALKDQEELKRVGLLLIMRLIWKRAMQDPSRIKTAIIEEIGVLFQIEEARAFVASLWKLGRTYNLWPVGITQEVSDFRLAQGLINNTSQFIIGKVSPEEAGTIADVLSLNEAAHDLILSLGGERGLYREFLVMTVREDGTTGDVIQYWPSRAEYWTYTTHPKDKAKRSDVAASYGGNTVEAIRALAGAR